VIRCFSGSQSIVHLDDSIQLIRDLKLKLQAEHGVA
jgi:ubiquitin C